MRACALCGLLVLSLAAGPARGDAPPSDPLRWPDVVRMLDTLPRMQEAVLRAHAARAEVRAAGQVPNPEAEVRLGRGLPRDGTDGGLEWGVGLEVPFDWIGPRGAAIRAARALADAGGMDVAATRRELLGQVATRFNEVALGARRVAACRESLARGEELADRVRMRVARGEARPADLSRVEVERERAALDRDEAVATLRAARAALAALLGVPEANLPAVAPDGFTPPAPPTRDQAIERAAQGHPRLAAAQARVVARAAQADAERARRIPGFALGAYFDRELDRDAAGAVLRVQLPLWNWNDGAERRARADQAAEARAAEADALALQAETAAAWERCTAGRTAGPASTTGSCRGPPRRPVRSNAGSSRARGR
jgi:cobalt-zinc-cadmium efflux system outer membrane protein